MSTWIQNLDSLHCFLEVHSYFYSLQEELKRMKLFFFFFFWHKALACMNLNSNHMLQVYSFLLVFGGVLDVVCVGASKSKPFKTMNIFLSCNDHLACCEWICLQARRKICTISCRELELFYKRGLCKTVVRLRKQTLSLSIFVQIIFSSFPAFLLILILTTVHRTGWSTKDRQRLKGSCCQATFADQKDEKQRYFILIFFIVNKLSKVEKVLSYFYRRASIARHSIAAVTTAWIRLGRDCALRQDTPLALFPSRVQDGN